MIWVKTLAEMNLAPAVAGSFFNGSVFVINDSYTSFFILRCVFILFVKLEVYPALHCKCVV